MNPAQEMLGLTINGRWRVISKLPRLPGATGGAFSVGYIIESSSGQRAFLKALDFSRAFLSPDPAKMLQVMTEEFIYEKTVLEQCKDSRLSHVVFALEEGKMTLPSWPCPVQYLIFDLADGDIRRLNKVGQAFDLAWTLRALHHVSVGLWQLHKHGIAHQDLKPSNILVFSGEQLKVADLGRAESKKSPSPYCDLHVAGARSYAPPELLYHEISPSWACRRFGCDLYHLGSLVVFFFCGIQITAIIKKYLHPLHVWDVWQTEYRDVLPYVRDAFEQALEEIGIFIPPQINQDILVVIRQLCEPDPLLRGHPENRIGYSNPYSAERYVSFFNRFARKAELGLLKSVHNGH